MDVWLLSLEDLPFSEGKPRREEMEGIEEGSGERRLQNVMKDQVQHPGGPKVQKKQITTMVGF